VAASTDTSHSLITAVYSPTVTGFALDVIGHWVMQLFHHVKFGGFLLLQMECGENDTRSTPVTLNPIQRIEQQIQDSGWPRTQNKDLISLKSYEYKLEIRQRQLESC
jgi:hypothetical protein